MKYSFKLVMVQDITNDCSEDADSIYENYVFQFGAMKDNYSRTKMDGKKSESKEFMWNQIKNNASFKAK